MAGNEQQQNKLNTNLTKIAVSLPPLTPATFKQWRILVEQVVISYQFPTDYLNTPTTENQVYDQAEIANRSAIFIILTNTLGNTYQHLINTKDPHRIDVIWKTLLISSKEMTKIN